MGERSNKNVLAVDPKGRMQHTASPAASVKKNPAEKDQYGARPEERLERHSGDGRPYKTRPKKGGKGHFSEGKLGDEFNEGQPAYFLDDGDLDAEFDVEPDKKELEIAEEFNTMASEPLQAPSADPREKKIRTVSEEDFEIEKIAMAEAKSSLRR